MTAQLSFSPPDGGWNYIYEGDEPDYAPDGEGLPVWMGPGAMTTARISGMGQPLVEISRMEPTRRYDYH